MKVPYKLWHFGMQYIRFWKAFLHLEDQGGVRDLPFLFTFSWYAYIFGHLLCARHHGKFFHISLQQPCFVGEETMAQRHSITCRNQICYIVEPLLTAVFWLPYTTTLPPFPIYFVLLECTQYKSLEKEIFLFSHYHPLPLKQNIGPYRNGVWDLYFHEGKRPVERSEFWLSSASPGRLSWSPEVNKFLERIREDYSVNVIKKGTKVHLFASQFCPS